MEEIEQTEDKGKEFLQKFSPAQIARMIKAMKRQKLLAQRMIKKVEKRRASNKMARKSRQTNRLLKNGR